MTCLEHYFENLLFHGQDIKDESNKKELTKEEQKAVEICSQYVLYNLFNGRDDLKKYLGRE